MLKDKWGIINTRGDLIIPLKYDKIWALNEEYLCSIKAYDGTQETSINLLKLTSNNMLLDGLTYIATYSVNDFKELSNCSHVYIKKDIETNQLFFTYGTNIGAVAINSIPKEPMFSIVSKGKKLASNSHKTSFWDYENEKMNDYDNWSDPFGDERAFYDGWSREDVESGLADAYE